MSITRKITMVVLGCSLALAIGLALTAIKLSRTSLEEKITAQMQSEIDYLKYRIESELNRLSLSAQNWSKNWVFGEIATSDEDLNIAAYITEVRKSTPLVSEILVFNADGELVVSTIENSDGDRLGQKAGILKQASTLAFRKHLMSGQPMSELGSGSADSFLFLPIPDPQKPSGQDLLGFLAVFIDNAFFHEALNRLNLQRSVEDRLGIVLRYGSFVIAEQDPYPSLPAPHFKETRDASQDIEGFVALRSTLRIEFQGLENPLQLLIYQPKSIAFRSITSLMQALGGTTLAALCIYFPIGLLFSRKLGQPILELDSNIREIIQSGDMSKRTQILSGDEIGTMARAFNHLLDVIASKQKELEGYNENLEKLVSERSRTIQVILDHVKSGFLLVDRKGRVLPGFTRSCAEILNEPVGEGDSITRLLGFGEKSADHFLAAIDQVFDDYLPEEVNLSLLPSRCHIKERVVGLQSATVRSASHDVQALLFTLNDVTRLVAAETQAQTSMMLLKILRNLEMFKDFVNDFLVKIQQAQKASRQGDQKTVRAILHTLKGNCGVFDLTNQFKLIHQTEEKEAIVHDDIESIADSLKQFLGEHKDVLGLDSEGKSERFYQVPEGEVMTLVKALDEHRLKDVVQVFVERRRLRPARSMVSGLPDLVSRLSNRLGKKARLLIEGGETLVDPNAVGEVLQSLTHAVRNAIDHGIEEPWERGAKGEEGLLTLSFADTPAGLHIWFTEDGRGINIEKVREKARRVGLLGDDDAGRLPDHEVALLIFSGSFSTAEQVTDISGRGIGMFAIRKAVEASGGTWTFRSQKGSGTRLDITIPHRIKADLTTQSVAS